ncbi:16S rRNA (uracil(1498)-N(3))-methyltransferase [Antrihabitans cavernicola]|uniref:Ribosomal RNA small subunit methyltransferase E n=1 Tax=Antrihabitans cavernicola TaxID=2495913 RepID=A0A5A7SBP8_9NOCA|nr:16S rRNA (uracil(1498)-N(3))-methyltransferase [Spelaeibacter cavernicola]KAA0022984.1 16S rRNA (uracil(1498)-N(3))-methyltransferase [Spelaeibacter cavernicola]
MAATVFYIERVPAVDDIAVLDGKEGHHAATVRRIKVGERLTVSDGAGEFADTVVVAAQRDRLDLTVTRRWTVDLPRPTVTLVQALPKSERSELAVELATEAGIDRIVPWQASRCVARWDGPKAPKGIAKWRAAALAAAKQSRRAIVPTVDDLHDTAGVVELVRREVADGSVVAALHESASHRFADLPVSDAPGVVLIVGPEGGLDSSELDRLIDAGARTVLLGPTVLRTSTAAAVALGALGVLTRRWDSAPPQ